MNLEGLSSVCAKLEPASSKDNEILEISVLQKFTSHALLLLSLVKAFFIRTDWNSSWRNSAPYLAVTVGGCFLIHMKMSV